MNSARLASLLRTNVWILDLVIIVLASYFAAAMAAGALARALNVVPSVQDVVDVAPGAQVMAQPHRPAERMAERNIMGLKREQLNVPPELEGQQAHQPENDLSLKTFKESELMPCTLNGMLRATMVADDPRLSLAVVMRNDTHEPGLYGIDDGQNQIFEDAILVAVRNRAIVVRRRDHFERCLGEGDTGSTQPPVTVNMPSPQDEPQPTAGDMSGVTRLSGTDYRVERAEVDRALSNLNEVATQARIVPSFKNGKANGFKMFSIKPGSIYAKIGLQNGDVIQKINGYDMNSPDRALEIYTKLRDATSLSIELQRSGNTQTMNYAIN